MILIGRGLDFEDSEINEKETKVHLNRKLCSCQGVKTPQAWRRKKRKIGKPDSRTRGKREREALLPGPE